MTLKEGKNSSVGFLFLEVYGRKFRDMQEYDYWRNESVGRSNEELKKLMEKEKQKEKKKMTSKFIGKGVALAGTTEPVIGKGNTSFADSPSAGFKPVDNDFRGSMDEALKPPTTATVATTKVNKDWMHSAKPPSVVGFGVGDKLRVTLPKSQCPSCQAKAAQQANANAAYVSGTQTEAATKPAKVTVVSAGQGSIRDTFIGNVKRSAKAVGVITKNLGNAKVDKK